MQKSWSYALYFVLAAAALFGLSVLAARWFYSSPKVGAPQAEKTLRTASSPTGSVLRIEGSTGRMIYRILGTFVSGLQSQGEALVGQFVIAEDPNKTPVAVSIDIKSGTADVIFFTKSLDEEGDPEAVSSATLLEKITKGTPAALILTVDSSLSPVGSALDAVIGGSWSSLTGVTIEPATIGIVAKK